MRGELGGFVCRYLLSKVKKSRVERGAGQGLLDSVERINQVSLMNALLAKFDAITLSKSPQSKGI